MALRYSFGGDEFLFVEISEEMSLTAFFTGMNIVQHLQKAQLKGVKEVCLANASYQVNFDPDIIEPNQLLQVLQNYEAQLSNNLSSINTRLIEIPVLFNDPWTNETGAKFRDRHQRPELSDIEYAAIINNYQTIADFIAAYSNSPWFVTMVGFVAGLPFMFQMVERKKQIEVPKYLRPRLDTPKLTIGHGGCFSCIYSVRGAGGYQMFGITPVPIFDPNQSLPYFKDSMVFFKPGDIVKFKIITDNEYHTIKQQVKQKTFALNNITVKFDIRQFLHNPTQYNQKLLEMLQ